MQIDWFTLAAQVINFLVLVWLLKRFLYGPIVDAMERRAAGIADKLEHARLQEEKAVNEADKLKQERMELEQAREEMLAEVRHDVEEKRHRMLEEARHEIEALQKRWEEAFQREREAFLGRLQERIGREALELTRRILNDLAGEEVERQAVKVFIEKLAELGKTDISELLDSVRAAGEADMVVRSAFDITPEDRSQIEGWAAGTLPYRVPVKFETDPETGFGIELRIAGWKLSWNLAGYLGDVKEEMQRMMQEARWMSGERAAAGAGSAAHNDGKGKE